ncbi:F-box protein At3g44326-like [Henckelia pumila]|uniref:F-box protein At3g44326-like n=1 Tax=Henckelia pumila TaxID=405737 RepID=UPI003C6E367F
MMFPIFNMIFRPKSTGDKADIPNDVIQTHILNRLDGATLAYATCASTQFHALCSDDQLWRNICNSTWPSTTRPRVVRAISAFPSAHRSFYLDAFPSMHHQIPKTTRLSGKSSELISAVDIYYKDHVIYSQVLATETAGDGFLDNPFILRLLVTTPLRIQGKGKISMSLAKEHLRVSWIAIDPNNKRALNVASQKAVSSIWQWDGRSTIRLRYSKVAAVSRGNLVQWAVLVTCSRREETGEVEVEEVKMQMDDRMGKPLSGWEGLRILQAAMKGRRRRRDWRMEKWHYKIFSDSKLYRDQMKSVDYRMVFRIWSIMSLGVCVLSILLYLVRKKVSLELLPLSMGQLFWSEVDGGSRREGGENAHGGPPREASEWEGGFADFACGHARAEEEK